MAAVRDLGTVILRMIGENASLPRLAFGLFLVPSDVIPKKDYTQ